MALLIADTFTDSLTRLTGEEQKAVKTTAFDLQLNPANPGMKFHKLDRAKDKNFWSVRVNADVRLIVHKTAGSLLLCYVDHHDKAYAWAERRKLQTHPKTGAAQLVEIRETVQEVVVPKVVVGPAGKKAPPKKLPFASIPDDVLLGYGVPAEWLPDVRAADEDGILDVAAHLPAEAADAMLVLATGGKPRVPQPAAAVADPFAHPDARRRFRVMGTVEELQRALEYPWEKWTVFLHPDQQELVDRDYNGPARVTGSAGTGKTIVALHRAAHLARTNPDARVLLTTFSTPLAHALQGRLNRLLAGEPRLAERVDVYSLDDIGLRLHTGLVGPASLADRRAVLDLLKQASAAVGGHKFGSAFLVSEWDQVVDAWQLASWEEYRDVARLGRKTRLPEAQRKTLWAIFERVRDGLRSRGAVTPAGLFTAVAVALRAGKARPFDFAVVDEAQDVGVAQLRFFAALGGNRPNALFFAGDLGQRIFQQPFSWKALGIDLRGRSKTLKVNYRTSHQIREQADRLLGAEVGDADGNAQERADTVSVFNGPPPDVRVFPKATGERDGVGGWVAELIKAGVQPHEVGVFVRSDAQLDRAKAAVAAAGVPCRVLDAQVETAVGHVSVGTMHLAKGLEFRAVAVMACDDEVVPLQERIEAVGDDADLQEVYDTERYLLYVACTRARDHLLVSGTDPASEFLDDLGGGGTPAVTAKPAPPPPPAPPKPVQPARTGKPSSPASPVKKPAGGSGPGPPPAAPPTGGPVVSLPVLPAAGPLRLTPTDVTQFVRLEQCERFLRFRLAERAGHEFMEPYDVAPQRITPLLSLSGRSFEDSVEADLSRRFRAVHFAAKYGQAHNRPANNAEVAAEARGLGPGGCVLLFQVRLEVDMSGWRLRGDVDLLKLERAADGTLHLLIADMKATAEAKVEHRLQVTFYRLMLEALLAADGVAHAPTRTGVLFRPPVDPTPEEEAAAAPLRDAARADFGLEGFRLEVVADPEAYAQSARDLVLAPGSAARRVATAPFDDLPYALSFKCDGCLYTEFCMKCSAEREDLSLLPYMSGTEKDALRRAGVTTIRELAALKDFAQDGSDGKTTDLVPAPGREDMVKRLAATWPVGPRLDELVHRARQFRRSAKKDGTAALPFIPDKGNSSLPVSRPDLNPNLVWVYADAQFDYLEGRVYLLGALVVACENGTPARRRSVVRMRVRLRVEAAGVDCDLHEALLLSALKDGERVVLFPRWTTDERLPPDQRTPFTPTPKQMLYGPRAVFRRVAVTRTDAAGRAVEAVAEVDLVDGFGNDSMKPFVFPAIKGLKEDRYVRVTAGKLPEADLLFADEIFKASSAILNTLLRVLNERVYEAGDGTVVRVPLRLAVCASNEWPQPQDGGRELDALFDRLLFRTAVRPIRSQTGRSRLLWAADHTPVLSTTLTPAEADDARRQAAAVPWGADAREALEQILRELAREGVTPGDRRQFKAVAAARAYAWLDGAAEVRPEHLEVLRHVLWDDPQEQPAVAARVIARVANPVGMRVTQLLVECEGVLAGCDPRNLASAAAAAAKLGEIDRQLAALSGNGRLEQARRHVREQLRKLKLASIEAV